MPIVFQTDGGSGNADGAVLAALAGAGLCGFGLIFVVAILVVAGVWKMFAKAGRPGWAAIIPFYGDMIRNEIAGLPVVWTYYTWIVIALNMFTGGLFGLGPIIILVLSYFTYGPFLKAYGRNNDTLSVVLAVIFPYVIFPRIGFSDATYVGPDAAAVAALPDLPWVNSTSAPAAPPAAPPSIPTNTAPPSMKGTADDDLNKPQ